MLTVLHVINTLGQGGAENQLALQVTGFDRDRIRSIVCHLSSPAHLGPRISASGATVRALGLPTGLRSVPVAAARLAEVIRRERVDVVHTSLLESDIAGGIAATVAGVPSIATLCNLPADRERLVDNPRLGTVKSAATMEMWGFALRALHTRVVAISQSVADAAVDRYRLPPGRVEVIYRALPAHAPTRERPSRQAPRLLHVGRLAPQKGQKYLLEAMLPVLARHSGTRLLIVGEGWLEESLRRQVEVLGIAPNVEFLGRRDDVPELMASCDAFVFPSLFEGLGVSCLQAADHAMPCIVSDIGPLREVIAPGSGWLVPPRDPQALAHAILDVLDDPDKAREMGRRAQQLARVRFAKENILSQWMSTFESVSNTPRPAWAAPLARSLWR
jgi:glycosyltransferase involved in cell wall biosynthesis